VTGAGGVAPYRVRQAGHTTTGSRPSARSTSKLRHLRPDLQTPQRRPLRWTSAKSSSFNGIGSHNRESAPSWLSRRSRTAAEVVVRMIGAEIRWRRAKRST
jgi:hypothetical protein